MVGSQVQWVRDETLKSWLFHEAANSHVGEFGDAIMFMTRRVLYPDCSSDSDSIHNPLWLPFGYSNGVFVGSVFQGRPVLSQMFPFEEKIVGRFALDVRNEGVNCYLSNFARDAEYLELAQVTIHDNGDRQVRLAVYERNRPETVLFEFQTMEKRGCSFCQIRGLACGCGERMRRSTLPSIAKSLQNVFSAVYNAGNLQEAWQAVEKIFHLTSAGVYEVQGSMVVGGKVRPLNPFQKEYQYRRNSTDLQSATTYCAQKLLTEFGPVLLQPASSYTTDERILDDIVVPDGTAGCRGDDRQSNDDRQLKERSLVEQIALSVAGKRVGGRFVCPECDSTFVRKFDMQRHIRAVHFKERSFACPVCKLSFTHNSHVRAHVKSVHEKVMAASCPECGKQFSTNSKANRHLLAVHRKQRNFKCTVCNHAFFQRSDLRKHQLVHQ